ncbi:MAG TPA: nuclear transport factor 2 family protein [Flavobacterium sp.]|nr:nuclear transport factor 2 family protein [Flavobacterium sp.]
MSAKKVVQDFYKSEAVINTELMESYMHSEVVLDWHSTKGFIQMNRAEIIALSTELAKAYVRSKIRISHILAEGNLVSVRYSHFVKTIENPREEMLLAHFIVIWEIRDGKLYRGYQMSQLS